MISLIENGRQVGISRIFDSNITYTYAVQKVSGKYIVYIDKYNLDEIYTDELSDTETVHIYETLTDMLENFRPEYNISFEGMSVSKGHKFFNEKLYI